MRNSGLEPVSDAAEPSIARRTSGRSPQVERESPDQSEAPNNRSAPSPPPNRWQPPLMFLGPHPLVVGALGNYLVSRRYVSEDAAYVQEGLASISPEVAGQVRR